MTTKTIYISNDGEEFETEEECLAYERNRDASGAVLMFAANRLPITDTDSITAFEDASYLYILDEERAKAFFRAIKDDYSYAIPKLDEVTNFSLYAYEEDRSGQSYMDLDDKIAELEVLRDELLDRAREYMTELYLKEAGDR